MQLNDAAGVHFTYLRGDVQLEKLLRVRAVVQELKVEPAAVLKRW